MRCKNYKYLIINNALSLFYLKLNGRRTVSSEVGEESKNNELLNN